MTTRVSTNPVAVPTVTISGRQIRIHRHQIGYRIVGYVDLIDAHASAAEIRGALADAYTAGANAARDEATSIVHRYADDASDIADAITEWVNR